MSGKNLVFSFRPTVYVACALGLFATANAVAEDLVKEGFTVVSTWHSLVAASAPDQRRDPLDEAARRSILEANLIDLDRAELVLVMTFEGVPRATFCEAGYAIAKGKQVVWMASREGQGRCIFDASPLVTRVTTVEAAAEALHARSYNAGLTHKQRT
jgi:nucleoside 2-deoxyribosyltransferase